MAQKFHITFGPFLYIENYKMLHIISIKPSIRSCVLIHLVQLLKLLALNMHHDNLQL